MTEREGARPHIPRRQYLAATGGLAAGLAVAGCQGDGDGDGECAEEPESLDQAVPGAYEGATSEGDIERKPGRLLPKGEVDYQREPNGEQQCEKCSYYVTDKNDDCVGACVRVEGMVDPAGYCGQYRTQVGGGW